PRRRSQPVHPTVTGSSWLGNTDSEYLVPMLTSTASVFTVSHRDYDAVLFDQLLEERAKRTGEPFKPFDVESDYREYVDGKARVDGVASFLKSRGIEL